MTKVHTLKDLEKILGVKERTLFRYMQKGWLKGSKRGKWRFTEQDVRDFLQQGRKKQDK